MAKRAHLDLGNYLPYLINRVGFAMVASFTATLAPHGLSIDMWRVVAALSNNSGGSRQVDLSSMTSIDASTMSRLVTRLVRAGLVTRSRSEQSSREVVVALSAKGRALVARIIPVASELEAVASVGIAAKDMAAMKRTLRAIYDNMAGSRR